MNTSGDTVMEYEINVKSSENVNYSSEYFSAVCYSLGNSGACCRRGKLSQWNPPCMKQQKSGKMQSVREL